MSMIDGLTAGTDYPGKARMDSCMFLYAAASFSHHRPCYPNKAALLMPPVSLFFRGALCVVNEFEFER